MHLCNTTISKQLKISPDIMDTIDIVAIADTVGIVDDVEAIWNKARTQCQDEFRNLSGCVIKIRVVGSFKSR